MYKDLLLFSSLVYVPLAVGAVFKHANVLKRDVSKPIMQTTWLLVEPVVIVTAFWGMDLIQVQNLATAPLLGTIWMLAMLLVTMPIASALDIEHPQRGNFLLAGMFSNNGITLGSFLCMMLIGPETGLPMAVLFTLLFFPLLLTVGLGIGKYSIKQAALKEGVEVEPPSLGVLRLVPYAAMALGFFLNYSKIPFPEIADYRTYLVYADVAIYSFAIGTLFTLGSVRIFLRECIAMSGIKFILGPVIGLAIFFVLSQFLDLSPILLQVTVVQCAMPVAIMSVVASRLCGLDTQLAASCWVFTTLAVIGVVPVLAYVVPKLG